MRSGFYAAAALDTRLPARCHGCRCCCLRRDASHYADDDDILMPRQRRHYARSDAAIADLFDAACCRHAMRYDYAFAPTFRRQYMPPLPPAYYYGDAMPPFSYVPPCLRAASMLRYAVALICFAR